MKQTVKTIIIAAMLAISPNAFAADTATILGGLIAAVGGGALYASEHSKAEDNASACARANPGTLCEEEVSGLGVIGLIVGIGGGIAVIAGVLDDEEEPDYFTRNGLVMDGMTLGYTDTGMVGLQKKWEF